MPRAFEYTYFRFSQRPGSRDISEGLGRRAGEPENVNLRPPLL